jgi:(E)-2-((N-methylformamido)methylene)succinate hydrolase
MTRCILVHGVGLDHRLWDSMRASLPPERAGVAVTYDLIGHGNGPHRHGPYHLTDYVEQLLAVSDGGGDGGIDGGDSGEPIDLVGFSMGALIAQAFAAAHPRRVRRLVLLAAVYDRSPTERTAILERVAAVRAGGYLESVQVALDRWFSPSFADAHPDVVAAVRQRMFDNDPRAYADAYEVFATADADVVHSTQRISAPTLVIAGSDDPRSTPLMARRLAAALPNGQAMVLPGLRHCLMLEAPAQLAGLIDEFLG